MLREEPAMQPLQACGGDAEGHKLTNYFKWYFSNHVFPVTGFSPALAPYFVAE